MLDDLAQRLRAITSDRAAALRAQATFDTTRYARTLVDGSDGCELWLLGWLPDQMTDIHDHGGVPSASIVLAGHLYEEQYRVVAPGTVAFAGSAGQATGALDLTERDHVHRVRAVGGPAISLHLYAGTCASRSYAVAPDLAPREPIAAAHVALLRA